MNFNTGRIAQVIISIRTVEEKFAKIQENPALNGAENGLTAQELEILDNLIDNCGAAAFAADEIIRRVSGIQKIPRTSEKNDDSKKHKGE
jgi:hypothetical protein